MSATFWPGYLVPKEAMEILSGYVRLAVTEQRVLLLWRKLTISGPESVVAAAMREVQEAEREARDEAQAY